MTIEAQEAQKLTDNITRLTYNGMSAATRVSYDVAKRLLEKITANLVRPEQNQRNNIYKKNQLRLLTMLESGRKIVAVKVKDMDMYLFNEYAKRCNAKYVALKDDTNETGTIDILLYQEDMAKIARMDERAATRLEKIDMSKTYEPIKHSYGSYTLDFLESYEKLFVQKDMSAYPFALQAQKKLQSLEDLKSSQKKNNLPQRPSVLKKLRQMTMTAKDAVEVKFPEETLRRQSVKGVSNGIPIIAQQDTKDTNINQSELDNSNYLMPQGKLQKDKPTHKAKDLLKETNKTKKTTKKEKTNEQQEVR